jgi:hypothetical protein
MQALVAEFSGYAGKIPLLFWRGEFKNRLFQSIDFKNRLLNRRAAPV